MTIKFVPKEKPKKDTRFESASKQRVTLWIDKDVLEAFRSSGRGWQTRINLALRQYASQKQSEKLD